MPSVDDAPVDARPAALDMPPANLDASGSLLPSGAMDTSASSVGAFSMDSVGNTSDVAAKVPDTLMAETKKAKKSSFRLKMPSSLKKKGSSKSSTLEVWFLNRISFVFFIAVTGNCTSTAQRALVLHQTNDIYIYIYKLLS